MPNKGLPTLVTHVSKKNGQKLLEKLLSVCPETAREGEEKEKKKNKNKKLEWYLPNFLHYTQTQKPTLSIIELFEGRDVILKY